MIAFKRHRRNSIFYAKERKYLTAKAIGISVNTFGKYLYRLEKLGLVVKHNGCLVFTKLSTCIKVLLGKEGKSFSAFRFVPLLKEPSFKAVYASLQAEIFKLNISHQQYRIDRIKEAQRLLESNCINRGSANFIKRVSAQCEVNVSRIGKDSLYAKSGKNHIASLLGSSASTGLKRLRNWNRDGIIKRTVITKELLHVNHASFDLLKDHYKHILINRSTGKFFIQVGSAISL